MKREVDPAILEKRNQKLVEQIEQGFPCTHLGKMLGLTRERVGQIYSKQTGKTIRQFRIEKKLRCFEETKRKMTIKKKCHFCHKTFETTSQLKVYCSPLCNQKYWRRERGQEYKEFKKWKKERKKND